MWEKLSIVLATLAMLLSVGPAQSATIYSDRASWEAAVDGITNDPFGNDISWAATITLDSGIVSTQNGLVRSFDNRVIFGRFSAELGSAPGATTSITWTFPQPVIAFAADMNGFASFQVVQGQFDGGSLQSFPVTGSFAFFGVVGTTPFNSVTFADVGGNFGATLQIDNAAFATTLVPIPLPSALWLLVSALLGSRAVSARARAGSARPASS